MVRGMLEDPEGPLENIMTDAERRRKQMIMAREHGLRQVAFAKGIGLGGAASSSSRAMGGEVGGEDDDAAAGSHRAMAIVVRQRAGVLETLHHLTLGGGTRRDGMSKRQAAAVRLQKTWRGHTDRRVVAEKKRAAMEKQRSGLDDAAVQDAAPKEVVEEDEEAKRRRMEAELEAMAM